MVRSVAFCATKVSYTEQSGFVARNAYRVGATTLAIRLRREIRMCSPHSEVNNLSSTDKGISSL